MRIVYLIPHLYNAGGMERVTTTKANFLSEVEGYEVHIITAKQNSQPCFFTLNNNIRLHDLDISNEGLSTLFLYGKKLKRLLISLQPDICIATWWTDIIVLPYLRINMAIIGELHFAYGFFLSWYKSPKNGSIKYALIKALYDFSIGKLDAFVVLSKHDETSLSKRFNNVIQIYNPVDTTNVPQSSLKNPEMIAVGRLVKEKNFSALIPIWKKVTEKYPSWQLKIYGDGPERVALQEMINIASLSGSISVLPPTRNITDEMSKASALLLSSTSEGLGLVLIEAMAAGLPVVAFRSEGPEEIIRDSENGFLIEQGEREDFYRAIISLIENINLREKIGQNTVAYSKEFDVPNVMDKWIILFRKILHNDSEHKS